MSEFQKTFKEVRMETLFPIIEEKLKNGGSFKFAPHGVSMWPLVKEGFDNVIVEKLSRPLKKRDVIFYRRPDGKFVIHRIVGKNCDGFVLCGDNQIDKEFGVKEDWVIGIVSAVIKRGRKVLFSSLEYRIYSGIFVPLRKTYLALRRVLSKIKHAVIK
jgi:hypothetical protein